MEVCIAMIGGPRPGLSNEEVVLILTVRNWQFVNRIDNVMFNLMKLNYQLTAEYGEN